MSIIADNKVLYKKLLKKTGMRASYLFAGLIIAILSGVNVKAFNHPCLLHNQSDFDYVKAHINEEPYSSALVKLKTSQYAKSTYTPSPVEYLARLDANNWAALNSRWENAGISDLWYEGIHNNYTNFMKDAAAAYQLALLYALEDDKQAAETSKKIILEWSKKNKGILRNKNGEIIDPNEKLIMFQPYQIAVAIEMLRDYEGWGKTQEFSNVLSWIDNSFYPLCHEHLQLQNESGGGHYWMNWDLASMTTILAIGILTDNRNYVDEAINYYKGYGGGPGNISKGVPFLHSDPDSKETLGQGNELGRDQGHNTLCAAVLGTFCEMGLKIGEDLFAYDNYRVIAFAEYVAKYNLAKGNLYPNPMNNFSSMKVGESNSDFEYSHSSFPFNIYSYGDGGTMKEPSENGRGTVRPGWDYFVGYCNSNGISSIYSTKMAERIRPDGGGGQYSSNSGGFDQIGFSTLMGYRPSDINGSENNNENIWQENGNITLTPHADTQVRRNETTDYGNNTNMEIYYTLDKNGDKDKEFYGLMRFELPQQFLSSEYNINGVTLRLVCVQNKGNREMGLYKYDRSFSEHTTFEVEEQYIRTALSQKPFLTFEAKGQGPWSMSDKDNKITDNYKKSEAWTSYLGLTSLVMEAIKNGNSTVNFLISKINPTSEAMRFATKEAETIVNEDGFSFSKEELVPLLIINYSKRSTQGTPEEPSETPEDPSNDKENNDSPVTPEQPDEDDDNANESDPDFEEAPEDSENDGETEVQPDDSQEGTNDPEDPTKDPEQPENPQAPGNDGTENSEGYGDNDNNSEENNSGENENENNAIYSISDDESIPLYYDLTGTRISHPNPGVIYIEKKGKKIRKIIFQN